MRPLEKYQSYLDAGDFFADDAQRKIAQQLDQLYGEIISSPQEGNKKTFFGRLSNRFSKQEQNKVEGLYLWGGVGRGKTWLVDLFYDELPIEEKQRIHFHRFMRMVHAELATLSKEIDPLTIVADRLAKQFRVLCFDEFFVSDITDAMLLGRLMSELFERGIILVATSNIEPDGLYKDGLQRQRFLPAIREIKANCRVMTLDSDTDYRLRELEQADIYHFPLDDEAETILSDLFNHMATSEVIEDEPLDIENRLINTRWQTDGIVWFDFQHLCDVPRAPADYIEIAKYFHTVFIGNVHQMDDFKNDYAMRFINLVDEMYDRNVKLVVTAESEPERLYTGKKLAFQFERTVSRLQEMRSHEYLERPHLP